jgi:uncharacterized protein (TIGR03118 family)
MKQLFCKAILCLLLTGSVVLNGCKKEIRPAEITDETPAAKQPNPLKNFMQVNLVGNNDEYDPAFIDPALVNAWGLAFTSNGIAWVSSQAGHVSTVYNSEGGTVRPPVNIPSPGGPTGGNPTGVVFNGSNTDFLIPNPTTGSAAARFIFVGVDGQVSAWNSAQGNNAYRVADLSATSAFTGLTTAVNNGVTHLYAADFRAGNIKVWNNAWAPVAMSFTDPNLPSGYSPFNIQSIDNKLYVMYAKVDPEEGEEKTGHGLGFVDVYNPDGSLVKRLISKGKLNAPWGIAKAPGTFFMDNAPMPNVLLVGNFGDGRINVYDMDGDYIGIMKGDGNKLIEIEGLWAIAFPPAGSGIDPNRLYFAAGPDDEEEGLFGYIIKQ